MRDALSQISKLFLYMSLARHQRDDDAEISNTGTEYGNLMKQDELF